MILDSYIFSRSEVIIIIIMKKLFPTIIKTLTMASNNDEKYFRRVCIKARLVELSLLAAIYQFLIPKSKDCKTLSPTTNITICIMKTM